MNRARRSDVGAPAEPAAFLLVPPLLVAAVALAGRTVPAR